MSSFDGTTKSEHAEVDPLERLVEAFVDQSVPVGPDAAVNRRLIDAMNAASRRDAVTPAQPSNVDESWPSAGERPSRRRRLVRVFVQQAFSLAAAVAIVAGAAVLWRTPRESAQSAALPPAEALDSAEAVETNSTELARIFDALDAYLKMPRHQRADRQALEEVFAAVLRENPEFARSKSWRRAQQRLTVALEQPEVLTMGVSLLGTLSWTTYGRF
jgi:hypothetical protein